MEVTFVYKTFQSETRSIKICLFDIIVTKSAVKTIPKVAPGPNFISKNILIPVQALLQDL